MSFIGKAVYSSLRLSLGPRASRPHVSQELLRSLRSHAAGNARGVTESPYAAPSPDTQTLGCRTSPNGYLPIPRTSKIAERLGDLCEFSEMVAEAEDSCTLHFKPAIRCRPEFLVSEIGDAIAETINMDNCPLEAVGPCKFCRPGNLQTHVVLNRLTKRCRRDAAREPTGQGCKDVPPVERCTHRMPKEFMHGTPHGP